MKLARIAAITLALAAVIFAACNQTGLSNAPRATFSQLACLDANGDHRLNAADAADLARVPDYNADFRHDARDAAFLQGIDIPLDPQKQADACAKGNNTTPEYAVAHGFLSSSNVNCEDGAKAVLIVGVGGGVVNIKDKDNAAGIRSIVDGLQSAYDDRDVQTIAVLSGPAIVGADNAHSAMETWLTHATQVYLDRYPCLRVLLVGHSHGAVSVDVVASHLEGQYGDRIIEVVDVDRVDTLYDGDTTSRPRQVHVFNIFERNGGPLQGSSYDASNAENWDASDQLAPRDGDRGGPLQPVTHTTIDNSKSVKQHIIEQVIARP